MDKPNLAALVLALSTGEGIISDELRMLVDSGITADIPDSLSGTPVQNFQMAFEAMGGLPRLLLYADRNPGAFYKLYARMIRQSSDVPEPPPPLPEWVSPERLSYTRGPTGVDPMETEDDA